MKKVIRLTEADLTRIIKRVISEQFNGEIEKPEMELTSDEPDLEREYKQNVTIPQLKQIFHNFSEINCDNVSGYGEDYFETPEYVQIYCRHYNGKPRSYIYGLIKKYQQEQ
jgi:hypothetical protein